MSSSERSTHASLNGGSKGKSLCTPDREGIGKGTAAGTTVVCEPMASSMKALSRHQPVAALLLLLGLMEKRERSRMMQS